MECSTVYEKRTGVYNCPMKSTRVRRLLGILILLASLALLCWGLWPLAHLTQSLLIRPNEMQLPTPGGAIPVLFSWI